MYFLLYTNILKLLNLEFNAQMENFPLSAKGKRGRPKGSTKKGGAKKGGAKKAVKRAGKKK